VQRAGSGIRAHWALQVALGVITSGVLVYSAAEQLFSSAFIWHFGSANRSPRR
jgi:hypothetical protein